MTASSHTLPITIFSFGYKYKAPRDANLLFDVRFLQNPYHVKELRSFTGLVATIAEYVLENESGRECLQQLHQTIRFYGQQFKKGEKEELRIAIGCTGGHHRSVAVTEALVRLLREEFTDISHHHRDIHKESH